jgi:Sulfotransferase domain
MPRARGTRMDNEVVMTPRMSSATRAEPRDAAPGEFIGIAMWSGPRNISTALMRAFGARVDTDVVDEPFYAAYLARTSLPHPMAATVIASQPTDWRVVVQSLLGPRSSERPILYQKHMTHHMLPEISREWLVHMRNAFLIRDPGAVLASYVQKRGVATLADIGIVQQHELFEREAQRLGHAPPVIDGRDVLSDPPRMLERLCTALGIAYTSAMLSWPPGRRSTDGIWAPAWYNAVEQSTGFAPPATDTAVALPADLQRIADEAQPYYAAMALHRLQCNANPAAMP